MTTDIIDGWWTKARQLPSSNQNARPGNSEISLLVIHNISLPPNEFGGEYIEQFFCNKLPVNAHPYFSTIANLQVSAHCLIKRDGSVIQFVPFLARAWHAGRSSFRGKSECNDFSIGIELEGSDTIAYTDAQYSALAELAKQLMVDYPAINRSRIVGHEDIAPGRKTDPGEAFDWDKFQSMIE